jgi:hypothetical protein
LWLKNDHARHTIDVVRKALSSKSLDSFLNKAAIKVTLNNIPTNSKVVINATDTVYIAHDVLDLINEFKNIKSKELNISIKLVGFKEAYDLVNSDGYMNKVTIEHRYNVMKRKMEVIENKEIIFKEE